MQGIHLRFYTYENRKHGSVLMYEWLLERAKALGIHGGSAFRAIAGFGRHGKLHEQHFFELAGDVPVLVEFMLSEDEADALLADVRREQVALFYARLPGEFGNT
jgi:PII-like signaling protein